MSTQPASEHTASPKILIEGFPVLHPETIPCLSLPGVLCDCLLVLLLKNRPRRLCLPEGHLRGILSDQEVCPWLCSLGNILDSEVRLARPSFFCS